MRNLRKKIPETTKRALITEVGGRCPKCHGPLMAKKESTNVTLFDVAHIYPLNPSEYELDILKDEERLSDDIDSQDNLITLCKPCHKLHDTYTTIDEYRELVKIKKSCVRKQLLLQNWNGQQLDQDILKVSEALYSLDPSKVELTYKAVDIDNKTNDSLNFLTKYKIEGFIKGFYNFISDSFKTIEMSNSFSVEIIFQQIKTYYLMLEKQDLNQQEIFDEMVDWINRSAMLNSREKSEALISFFIQNCEVFKDATPK